MKVLFATSELAPWVKTGGLGDVAAALPPALQAAGVDIRVLVPAYPTLRAAFPDAVECARPHWLGGVLPTASLLQATTAAGTQLLLLDYAPYYDRPGNPYLGADGRDWPDNALRFGLLSRVAAWLGSTASTLDWRPDVVHCNDWQTALAPAYLYYQPGATARTLVTVHNLAFQGLFGSATLPDLGLPDFSWHPEGVEYYGYLSFLKAGLRFADAITTVSPTYAREIQTEAEGMGLDGLLRHRRDVLSGILNGIDTAAWDPAADAALVKPFKRFDAARLAAKAANKAALQRQSGLEERDDMPLFAIVSRLTQQKGLDLVAAVAADLLDLPAQLIVLGNGDSALEASFRVLAQIDRGRCAVQIGFDEAQAHRIEAGADIFLMPSRFEPCGLNQMYSLRYGTPPLVRATGGLADTVIDAADAVAGNGFVFVEPDAPALLAALRRAADTWRDKKRWRQLQKNGMAGDYSWAAPAQRYSACYTSLCAALRPL